MCHKRFSNFLRLVYISVIHERMNELINLELVKSFWQWTPNTCRKTCPCATFSTKILACSLRVLNSTFGETEEIMLQYVLCTVLSIGVGAIVVFLLQNFAVEK